MLDHQKVQQILRLRNEGLSLRQIQSATHCSLETIRRYINNPQRGLQERSVKPRSCKMDRFEQDVLIDLFHKSKGNFVVIARCLHHLARLRKIESFKIDASSVRRYYQSHFPDLSVVKPTEINPFDVEPGQQVQIDFVEALFQFVGQDQPTRLYIFEAIYAWSRKRYVRLCPDSQQSSWYLSILDCLLKNGCPRTILCDNDKSLVISHTRSGVRFNPGFTWLCKPFGIVPVACKPRRAKTKGRIERTGGYIKQNALAEANAIGNIENLEQLQHFLDKWVIEVSDQRKYWVNNRHQTAESLYEQEKSFLHFVPEDQQAQAIVNVGSQIVSDRGTVTVYGWSKSIGYRHKGRTVCCYVRPNGSCMVMDIQGRPIISFCVPAAYMQNFDLNTRPAQKEPRGSTALPTEDRYLNELSQFLEF